MQVKNTFNNYRKISFFKIFDNIFGKGLYVLFLILMIISLSQKCNYHVDEIWTYGLSNQNGSYYLNVTDGEEYEPGEKPFLEFLTVQPEHRFDYANVWFNQSNDVHPPLYYVLVHTVCSFFPKHFSPWFAGGVNLFFALLTLSVVRKLIPFFIKSPFIISIISLAFVLSAGVLHSTTFLRMYVAAMFWVTFLTYCYIKRVSDKYGNEKKFLVIASVVTLLGSLTHYYCMVYSVLISITYFIYLIIGKKYKETRNFCFTMMDTGIILYFIFPAVIHHIFFSNRGQEVFINANNISDFLARLNSFYLIINQQLFGNIGTVIFLAIVAIYLYVLKCNKIGDLHLYSNFRNQQFIKYMFLCLPACLYFIIISKISVLIEDRYLFPIYAVTFCAVVLAFIKLLRLLLSPKNVKMVAVLVLSLITIGSWINCKWTYLYLGSREFLKKIDAQIPVECVSIYSNNWEILPLFVEAKEYQSIRFIKTKNEIMIEDASKTINDNSKNNKIVLSLAGIPENKHQNYINVFLNKSGRLSAFKKLGTHQFSTSYILYAK